MSLVTVLIIILIVVAVGGLPTLGYHDHGWGPSGVVGLLVVVLLVLLLLGKV